MPVVDVVRAMSDAHYRSVIVQYSCGDRAFFDLHDINRQFFKLFDSTMGPVCNMVQIGGYTGQIEHDSPISSSRSSETDPDMPELILANSEN